MADRDEREADLAKLQAWEKRQGLSKTYLGDGAYVDMGSYHGEIVLTTEDGERELNRVVLGVNEWRVLQRWAMDRGFSGAVSS